jgi:hypothetical protein
MIPLSGYCDWSFVGWCCWGLWFVGSRWFGCPRRVRVRRSRSSGCRAWCVRRNCLGCHFRSVRHDRAVMLKGCPDFSSVRRAETVLFHQAQDRACSRGGCPGGLSAGPRVWVRATSTGAACLVSRRQSPSPETGVHLGPGRRTRIPRSLADSSPRIPRERSEEDEFFVDSWAAAARRRTMVVNLPPSYR